MSTALIDSYIFVNHGSTTYVQQFRFFYVLLLTVFLVGCKDVYHPPVKATETSFLVVEGVLNIGQGATTFQLSRTANLKDPRTIIPELKAQLFVESKTGVVATFTEKGGGAYSINQLQLASNNEYRVRIKTSNGKEYVSDFMFPKTTPIIDSISWTRNNNGVQIHVNTHDSQNNTRYYKWDYEETWEIRSRYDASYRYIPGPRGSVRPVAPGDPNIFFCWKNSHSTNILIGSTARLQADIVDKGNITLIPPTSDRLSVRYSILVTQYALDKKGYEFFEMMKKNTESLGTIFDAQPVEINGNLHCISNEKEPVIGYISIASLEQKRIFITNAQVPGWGFRLSCQEKLIPNNPDSINTYMPGFLPYEAEYAANGNLSAYYSASADCVDCRLRGGTNVKPAFW